MRRSGTPTTVRVIAEPAASPVVRMRELADQLRPSSAAPVSLEARERRFARHLEEHAAATLRAVRPAA